MTEMQIKSQIKLLIHLTRARARACTNEETYRRIIIAKFIYKQLCNCLYISPISFTLSLTTILLPHCEKDGYKIKKIILHVIYYYLGSQVRYNHKRRVANCKLNLYKLWIFIIHTVPQVKLNINFVLIISNKNLINNAINVT